MTVVAFEDFQPGETRSYGDYEFTAPEMIAFARVYDAQPFHLDDEAARHTIFGGLAASGWHTCSALMRMNVDGWLSANHLSRRGRRRGQSLARPGAAGRPAVGRDPNAGKIRSALSSRRRHRQIRHIAAQSERPGSVGAEALDPVRAPRASGRIGAARRRQNPRSRLNSRVSTIPGGALPENFAKARVGAYADLGETHFSADFIKSYAEKFDPLPFHTDEEAGKAHMLGAMSAPGWQTASCWMRHFIALRQKEAGGGEPPSLASPGFADLVWRKPVLLGDTHRLFDPGRRQARHLQTGRWTGRRAATSASISAARSRWSSSARCFRPSSSAHIRRFIFAAS